MAPTLYTLLESPPVRAVLLCAKALQLELNLIEVDLLKGEHISPTYTKINPLHTVPTLVDEDGFVLYDSHAIMPYLVEKYGKDTSLYPPDLKKRSLINQRLHFDSGTLFARGLGVSKRIVFRGMKNMTQEETDDILESYGFVEKFLENSKWVAGDELSVADFSIITTITAWDVLLPIEESKHPKIKAWIKQMEALPYYHDVQKGLEQYKILVKSKLSG